MATGYRRRGKKRRNTEEVSEEALARALENKSEANYSAIVNGFTAKGIPEADIVPRENVFTFHAWNAKGRQVMKGEHGVKIFTRIKCKTKDPLSGEEAEVLKGKSCHVFHISQTKLTGEEDPVPTPRQNGNLHSPPKSPKKASEPDAEKLSAKFSDMASNLTKHITEAMRPMTQNHTPKRYRQYMSRMFDGGNMLRTQSALKALSEMWGMNQVPETVKHLRTKSDVAELVRRRGKDVPNGYNPHVVETDEYADESLAGVFLQCAIEAMKSPVLAEEDRQQRAIQIAEAGLRGQKIDGFFPTPEILSRRMVRLAGISEGMEVLEPSAGIGSIAEIIQQEHPKSELLLVECHHALCNVLKLKGFEYLCGDIMQVEGTDIDRIVMNPPYENGQDMDHVRWCFRMLKRGGRLVALMSPGFSFRKDGKAQSFRNWLNSGEVSVESNDELANAFKGVEAFNQTGIIVRLLVLNKI